MVQISIKTLTMWLQMHWNWRIYSIACKLNRILVWVANQLFECRPETVSWAALHSVEGVCLKLISSRCSELLWNDDKQTRNKCMTQRVRPASLQLALSVQVFRGECWNMKTRQCRWDDVWLLYNEHINSYFNETLCYLLTLRGDTDRGEKSKRDF